MEKKVIISSLSIMAIGIVSTWYLIFYKPTHFKRNVADERGISITADALVKAYQANEQTANVAFLDMPLQITGQISATKPDQTGQTTINLKSDDPFAGVFCTLNATEPHLQVGQQITVKGICTGFLSDVVLKDAIIMK
jgi:hypothetical protein